MKKKKQEHKLPVRRCANVRKIPLLLKSGILTALLLKTPRSFLETKIEKKKWKKKRKY